MSPQTACDASALAIEGAALKLMVILSLFDGQLPLVTVQKTLRERAGTLPTTAIMVSLLSAAGVLGLKPTLEEDQVPVPMTGFVAMSCVDVPHTLIVFAPMIFALEGFLRTVIFIESNVGGQGANVTCQ
jgi:hypothetical protein